METSKHRNLTATATQMRDPQGDTGARQDTSLGSASAAVRDSSTEFNVPFMYSESL